MTYLLDTVTVIAILNKRRIDHRKALKNYVKAKALHQTVNVNGICCYEIKRGLFSLSIAPHQLSQKIDRFDEFCNECEVLLFDDLNVFETAAALWASLPRGDKLRDNDLLMASHANSQDLILVTKDADFTRVAKHIGVQIEDWT
ncbi:MAG: PIN domain-containing protein [Halobacteriota archaeon]|jgi:predicted nucleic acid-binding protein